MIQMEFDFGDGTRREVGDVPIIQHFAGNHPAPTINSLKRDDEAGFNAGSRRAGPDLGD
jgi:hypothetical protein